MKKFLFFRVITATALKSNKWQIGNGITAIKKIHTFPTVSGFLFIWTGGSPAKDNVYVIQ